MFTLLSILTFKKTITEITPLKLFNLRIIKKRAHFFSWKSRVIMYHDWQKSWTGFCSARLYDVFCEFLKIGILAAENFSNLVEMIGALLDNYFWPKAAEHEFFRSTSTSWWWWWRVCKIYENSRTFWCWFMAKCER